MYRPQYTGVDVKLTLDAKPQAPLLTCPLGHNSVRAWSQWLGPPPRAQPPAEDTPEGLRAARESDPKPLLVPQRLSAPCSCSQTAAEAARRWGVGSMHRSKAQEQEDTVIDAHSTVSLKYAG
ncbi:hypothetical protein NDU88_003666 [Pleurodeles waltl]|uniref:Uncharacterized protein n=1 Tax=Pleurodeles waltl TaxID=8319 RepID=A0AAV7PA97_PLEWA|nr:hypothetical protein NDU88_003666 [Pleurodeles waltl]